ncbi:hypothetical protein FOZ60_000175 [Perkinsus olseni]|uniref:Uncharacterized protein n=1 Tax=Perkinsus olseni TaxID=32597 RepID=A0A7J6PK18_PEROL|nr:hypothetical protein FOZ60_000175 [Perkinsus olseni]
MADGEDKDQGRYQQDQDDTLDWTGLLALFIYWGVSIGYYTIFHSLIFVGGTEYRWVLLGLWLGTITITLVLVAVWTPKRRKLREEVGAVARSLSTRFGLICTQAGLGRRVTIAESLRLKEQELLQGKSDD